MAHGVATDGLQASAISIEGEIAVAHRNLAVEVGPVNIMPGDQGVAVNGRI
jgi:hypothetical protein